MTSKQRRTNVDAASTLAQRCLRLCACWEGLIFGFIDSHILCACMEQRLYRYYADAKPWLSLLLAMQISSTISCHGPLGHDARWFANNTGADQPVHPRSLISAFVNRFLESIISRLATSEISNF